MTMRSLSMEAQRDGGTDGSGAEGSATGSLGAGRPGPGQTAFDLLDLDLETLRTVEHPVLSALVEDLQERIAAPGGEALWGFDNSM
jgi:FXSXX-COOH protein